MKATLLIRGARQLITLRGAHAPRRGAAMRELGIIPGGAVLVRDGKIAAVGQGRRVENLAAARDAVEIDATRRVALPGFVDSHTHLISGPPRLTDYEMRIAGASQEQIAAGGGGFLSTLRAVRSTPSRSLERSARNLLEAFARHGATTVESKSGYGLDRRGEMKSLRVLARLAQSLIDVVPTFLGARAVPPEYEGRPSAYLDWLIREMLPVIARRRLARFADISCSRDGFQEQDCRRYLDAARRLGLGLKLHADHAPAAGGVRLAVELGAASIDHLDHICREDVAALAGASTIATLLPGASFHLGLDRYPPARELIDGGAAVALATNYNPGASPTSNMQMILSLACSQMRMTPAEAVTAATINGAWAVGAASRVGSLEAGKDADLTLFEASDYREIPFHFGVGLVTMTIKRGVVIYERGKVTWPDNW